MWEKEGLLLIGSFDTRLLIFLKFKLWVLLEKEDSPRLLKARLLVEVARSVMDLVLLERSVLPKKRLS